MPHFPHVWGLLVPKYVKGVTASRGRHCEKFDTLLAFRQPTPVCLGRPQSTPPGGTAEKDVTSSLRCSMSGCLRRRSFAVKGAERKATGAACARHSAPTHLGCQVLAKVTIKRSLFWSDRGLPTPRTLNGDAAGTRPRLHRFLHEFLP